jgi:zinc transport system ATP-binding protein
MPNVLHVSNLSVRFGSKAVLEDLSFSVEAGSTLAVIGPNGSGKTVLFKALIGALPSEGTITWAPGTRIGYVPQKLDLERDLPISGRDFLRAKASVSQASPADVTHAMEVVHLGPAIAAQPIGTLSGGQFQRLLLAFALMGRPTVLLFDEPTASVDAPGEEGLYTTLARLQQTEHMTLLFISHELSLVYHRADTVLCLSPFRGACLGPPLEILTPERLQEAYGVPLKFHVAHGHDGHAD